VPSLAEAVSATGGIALALGVLLITIDIRAQRVRTRRRERPCSRRWCSRGYLTVFLLLPAEPAHPAGIAAGRLRGYRGAIGWGRAAGARTASTDVRPFLVLTILAWIIAFVVSAHAGGARSSWR